MKWAVFVNSVCNELIKGNIFSDFRCHFEDEQALTHTIAIGLRKLFASSFSLPVDSDDLYHNVTYRKGNTEKDKRAYSLAKDDRWVFFHDVFFAPDILIRRESGGKSYILPIEVKLITEKSPSQSIATAIGQSLIYTAKYPQSIVFLGVLRSTKGGKYRFRISRNSGEQGFYDVLKARGVRAVIREVGK
jgi:hypothetical protein